MTFRIKCGATRKKAVTAGKPISVLLFTLLLTLGFCACGTDSNSLSQTSETISVSPAQVAETTEDSNFTRIVATAFSSGSTEIAEALREMGVIKRIEFYDFFDDGSCLRTCAQEFATANEANDYAETSIAVQISNYGCTVSGNTVTYRTKTEHYFFDLLSQKDALEELGYVCEIVK